MYAKTLENGETHGQQGHQRQQSLINQSHGLQVLPAFHQVIDEELEAPQKQNGTASPVWQVVQINLPDIFRPPVA